MNKEHSFISAVVFVDKDCENSKSFLKDINNQLDTHFLKYEIIVVNRNGDNDKIKEIKEWASNIKKPLTIINMSLNQPHEQCMNAGIDMSIGDYVYEFDTTERSYNIDFIWKAYEAAVEGNDIVTVSPSENSLTSKMFYKVFNSHSNAKYPIGTDVFRIVSRRAINRAHAINNNMPYRKATYANSGLKMKTIVFDGKFSNRNKNKNQTAIDSLVLYTDFGYKLSLRLSLIMLLITVVGLIYTICVWAFGNPISGWTTTMITLTIGFTGLFSVSTVILKYLSLILGFLFRKQSYYVENIEKF